MEKLIDYVKYTIALAVGLFLYIPANFLPIENTLLFWTIVVIMGATGVSIICGIMLYSRATVILIQDESAKEDEKGWVSIWGNCHLYILVGCFIAILPFFFWLKVIAPVPLSECIVILDHSDDVKKIISFPCKEASS